MALDAVILDLGNVLVLHDNQQLFSSLGDLFGVPPTEVQAHFDGGLWARANRGELPGDALRASLSAHFGRAPTPGAWLDAWNGHFTVNEEMAALTEFLVDRFRLVLLSNTHDQHFTYLRGKLPVLERFHARVLSCEAGLLKPDKRIYQEALARAGTLPWKTVFFDDVAEYAKAATQVGMHGRVFTSAAALSEDLSKL